MAHGDLFGEGDDDGGTIFRDVITLALCGFVSMVVMTLPHLNPQAVNAAATESIAAPGNVVVEIRWPGSSRSDVDLWVQAPGDVPVGYSNKGGLIFNLLRDDLGLFADVTPLNYEIAYARGVPPGEYAVNVHLYRASPDLPVPVTVTISTKAAPNDMARELLTTKVMLRRENEELTVFRFKLDEDASLVPGSVSSFHRPLRSTTRKERS